MKTTRTGRVLVGVALAITLAACDGAPADTAARGDRPAASQETVVQVHRSATCQCCEGHERHLADTGLAVESTIEEDIEAFKDDHGVPAEARSCHTALIDGYVVEGHVPRAAIDTLLRTRPAVDGIALPGMPPGAPGMGGEAQGPLEVVSFTDGEVATFLTLSPGTR